MLQELFYEFYLFYSRAEFHVGADLIVWDAKQLLRCSVQTFFLGVGGGVGRNNNNPKTSLAFPLVEVKTVSLLTSQPKVVGRYSYNCHSRSRFVKNKMHLAELDWKEQNEVYLLVCLFLTRPYCNAELYVYIFPCSTLRCFGVWV